MALLPAHITAKDFKPDVAIFITFVHIAALIAAPFFFSWPGLATMVVMSFVTGCLGITLCYHRLLSHRSFKTHKAVKYFLMFCGTLSFQGDPGWWTATHRLHHKEADLEKDPHSPRVSFLWAHILWLFFTEFKLRDPKVTARFIPDLVDDPWAKFLHKFFIPVNLAFLAAMYGVAYALAGPKIALSVLVWGGLVRIVYVWHITWFVNSVTHLFGYRNYEAGDDSLNLWWVALLANGEGWHNNHHANPSAAKSGHKWWEFDLTYGIISLMEKTGLAWKVHPVVHTRLTAAVSQLKPRRQARAN